MKHNHVWRKTCSLAATLVTFKHFKAEWLLKLQNGHFLSRELSKKADVE